MFSGKNYLLFNIIYDTVYLIKKIIISDEKNIWLYNISDPRNILISLFIKFLTKKKYFIILADYTPNSNKILSKLVKYLIRKSNGIISLRKLSKDIENPNNIVVHGFYKKNSTVKLKRISIIQKPTKILFSGLLSEKLGIELAISTYIKMNNIILYIT